MKKGSKVLISVIAGIGTGILAGMFIRNKKKRIEKIKADRGEFWKYDEAWFDDVGNRHTANIVDVGGKLIFTTSVNNEPAKSVCISNIEEIRRFDKFINRVWGMGLICEHYDTEEGSYHGIGSMETKGLLTFANGVKLEVPATELFVEAELM